MFAVTNKAANKFFAGFDASDAIIWTANKAEAKAMTHQGAKTQAALFIANGVNAQRKPVAL